MFRKNCAEITDNRDLNAGGSSLGSTLLTASDKYSPHRSFNF